MKRKTHLAIVEDHAAFRREVVKNLNARAGWKVVAACATAEQALREIPEARPDLVLLDIVLPRSSGIELIPKLKTALPNVPIAMLTVVEDSEQICRAIRARACGYILKRDRINLIEGIEVILAGGAPLMSPSVARKLWELEEERGDLLSPERQGLTPREWEVFTLAARGKLKKEIAAELEIALDTVRNHYRSIYEKLGARSVIEAVMKIQGKRGLLDN